ncbi:M23 family metallopeptidase [Massilia sp. R798]|uniref:M23 family metallopeptidase n=3 Tax=Pseudomonadota TaxID=1224 RepID=A0ABS7SHZ4_9BURK|nr:M23 family metallopeptidase [Massilia soli]
MSPHAICIATVFTTALALAAGASASAGALPEGCEPARAGAAAAHARASAPFPPIQLQVRTPLEPTVLPSAGKSYLVYELHLHNFSAGAMSLRGIQVLDADQSGTGPVAEILEAQLDKRMRKVTIGDSAGDPRKLASGQGTVAFLCLAFDRGAPVPARLRHRILLDGGIADGPVIGTRATALRVLGRPVVGTNWSPDNNPSLHSHHRMGLWVAGGAAQISRRYAFDWKKYGKDGNPWSGDQRDVRAYHAYGEKTVAVADGTVIAAQDGYPDNIPRTAAGFEPAVPVTMESIAGNRVVLDIGGGQFAYYAHLQPGSVRVKAGDRVRRGQWLAAVGNSGDARQPHLHFQLTNSADIMASEGLPHLFDRYRVQSAGGAAWELRSREYPMGSAVVDFGAD